MALLAGLVSKELGVLEDSLVLLAVVDTALVVLAGLMVADCKENTHHYPGTCLEGRFLAEADNFEGDFVLAPGREHILHLAYKIFLEDILIVVVEMVAGLFVLVLLLIVRLWLFLLVVEAD